MSGVRNSAGVGVSDSDAELVQELGLEPVVVCVREIVCVRLIEFGYQYIKFCQCQRHCQCHCQ